MEYDGAETQAGKKKDAQAKEEHKAQAVTEKEEDVAEIAQRGHLFG